MRYQRIIGLVMIWMLSASVGAQNSPVPMLEISANQIIDTLRKNQSNLKHNQHIVYESIEKYLLPHVDVDGMARSVLGRQSWNKASITEKKDFTQAFTRLVIRTYASPLAEYSGEKIKFLPQSHASIDSHFIRVNSIIQRPNGQNIALSYHLVSKNGQWKIYDLNVEGVSLLQSFRSQFAQLLQNSSMQELLVQMRQQQQKKAA